MSCGGQCCALFVYSSTKEVLLAEPEKHLDGEKIGRMLRRLSLVEALERAVRYDIDLSDWIDFATRPGEHRPPDLYTCVHWDEETRLCGIYEDRPIMCREYPYGKKCAHCDCTDGDHLQRYYEQNDESPS